MHTLSISTIGVPLMYGSKRAHSHLQYNNLLSANMGL